MNRERAIGYGYISEKDLIFAVSHLAEENNNFCSYANIFELIRGQLSSVTVSGNEIFVRGGVNSFTPGDFFLSKVKSLGNMGCNFSEGK